MIVNIVNNSSNILYSIIIYWKVYHTYIVYIFNSHHNVP